MRIICDRGRMTYPDENGIQLLKHAAHPVVVLVHGYSFDPVRPGPDNPFDGQFEDWKRALGNRHYVEFGWYSAPRTMGGIIEAWRNGHATTYGRAWSLAEQAGRMLAGILDESRRPVSVVAHSLGTRVVCEAMKLVRPGAVGRVLFWNGAEYVRNARAAALAAPDTTFLNIAVRTDGVLERLGDVFAPGSGRCVGNDGLAPDAPLNWTDVFLDDDDLGKWENLTGASLRGDDPSSIGDHWESYRHAGNWPLYREFLDGSGMFGIAEAPGDPPGSPDDLFGCFLERLLVREGGASLRPAAEDPGGPTRQGISQRFLDSLNRRTPASYPQSVFDLTDGMVAQIYRSEFFDPIRIPALAAHCRAAGQGRHLPELVFDIGVMSGTGLAARLLQGALVETTGRPIAVDGILGAETLACFRAALDSGAAETLTGEIISSRLAFLDALPNAAANPGWRSRTLSFVPSAGPSGDGRPRGVM
jgi:lysozyme family protein